MIIDYSVADGLRLLEPGDFRKFKVVLRGLGAAQPPITGVRFIDEGNALVGIDLVPALPGAPADAAWREGFDAMVKAARKHGWIDESANAIRAHIERVD